jgi:hypothetical protein
MREYVITEEVTETLKYDRVWIVKAETDDEAIRMHKELKHEMVDDYLIENDETVTNTYVSGYTTIGAL